MCVHHPPPPLPSPLMSIEIGLGKYLDSCTPLKRLLKSAKIYPSRTIASRDRFRAFTPPSPPIPNPCTLHQFFPPPPPRFSPIRYILFFPSTPTIFIVFRLASHRTKLNTKSQPPNFNPPNPSCIHSQTFHAIVF